MPFNAQFLPPLLHSLVQFLPLRHVPQLLSAAWLMIRRKGDLENVLGQVFSHVSLCATRSHKIFVAQM